MKTTIACAARCCGLQTRMQTADDEAVDCTHSFTAHIQEYELSWSHSYIPSATVLCAMRCVTHVT
jgi:hypothetical protein